MNKILKFFQSLWRLLKKCLIKCWKVCQRFWFWLTGEDSLKEGEKSAFFYGFMFIRPFICGFLLWFIVWGIVKGPLFLLIIFISLSIIVINFICLKCQPVNIETKKENVDAKSTYVDGELYIQYNEKEYPVVCEDKWGLIAEIIDIGKNSKRAIRNFGIRKFLAYSGGDREKWISVTEIKRASEDYKLVAWALFGTSLFLALLGFIVWILAIIQLF